MPPETDPPRKHYGFKDRAFKRDNPPAAELPPAPTAKDLAMLSGAVAPAAPRGPGTAKAGDPNDVFAVLQGNRRKEIQRGEDALELAQVRSRRRRDFWLVLLPVEVTLLVVAIVGRHNSFVFVGAISAMGLFGTGITWVMWQVMNRY